MNTGRRCRKQVAGGGIHKTQAISGTPQEPTDPAARILGARMQMSAAARAASALWTSAGAGGAPPHAWATRAAADMAVDAAAALPAAQAV